MLRGLDSNQRPRDYEPRELPLLYPAVCIGYYTKVYRYTQPVIERWMKRYSHPFQLAIVGLGEGLLSRTTLLIVD